MIRKPTDDEPEKKERVIHTRVPESLEAELRERAQKLGISVSNLVRNVLNHTFGLVGDVVADGTAIARAATRRATGAPAEPAATSGASGASGAAAVPPWNGPPMSTSMPPVAPMPPMPPMPHDVAGTPWPPVTASAVAKADDLDDVLGWQPIMLGKNAVCAKCNDILPRGTDAATGLSERGTTRFVICTKCLAALREP